MTTFSLRQRVSFLVMLSLLVVWTITAVFSYRESREEINELYDAQLEQGAHIILLLDLKRLQRLVEVEGSSQIAQEDSEGDDPQTTALPFQVWSADGHLLLHNAGAPHLPFQTKSGFSTEKENGKTWRSMALWNRHKGFQIRVFEDAQQRRHVAESIVWRMLLPLLIALPGLLLLIWLSIGRGLKPLQAMSSAIAARHANKLDLITLKGVPAEVEPVVSALNDLLARLSHSMDQERRFTANAAHELRTPLAAIQVQAEVALAAQDKEQQDQAMRGVIEGIKHSTRLSEQLLMLARLDHIAPSSQQNIDLSELARRCAAAYADSALEKDIELSVNTTGATVLRGDPLLLEAMLGNLINNAIRYTQSQGNIEIDIDTQYKQIRLSVKDDGPGLSEDDKARVLNRFFRVEGSGTSGSGLGLSIVERIAQVHGATLLLEQGLDGKGLGVSVIFPATGNT